MTILDLVGWVNDKKKNDTDHNLEWCILKDYLLILHQIMNLGDCNICRDKNNCPIVPSVGQHVRYNCAFYKAEDEQKELMEGDNKDKFMDEELYNE